MVICLKGISEECFSFNFNVNASLKFFWALGGLSEGTQALGHLRTWAHEAHSDTRVLKPFGHSST